MPDVCCQDLIIETDNADGLADKAQGVAYEFELIQ